MKKIIISLFAVCCVHVNAFTLDFTAYVGQTITPGSPLVVFVPGYGDVRFSSSTSTLTVDDSSYLTGATIGIEPTESLLVTFLGEAPYFFVPDNLADVSFGFNALNTSDGLAINLVAPDSVLISMSAGGNGAGLREVTFAAVPEPSTTMLGTIGMLALALRRRRA
jgi:hypothetical protein